jgi:cell division protein FtsB
MTGLPATAIPRRPSAAPPRLRVPRPSRRLFTVLAVIGVVALVALNVGRQAFVGWTTDQQAEQLAAQVAAAEAQNAAFQRQLDYLQSDAYVTAEARRLGNLGYPGEQVLIIPAGAAVPAPATSYPTKAEERPMLERWLTLFFGDGSSNSP